MSEVQKPVEEAPVAVPTTEPVEAPAATEAAATEAPAAEAPKETPVENGEATPAAAETTEATAEQPKEEAKEEITPATEGVLGHKGPGLVKGLRFSKRFFYFSNDPVEAKQLSVFQQNEKPAVANPIVAWATQTGKGLLFLTKRAEDKTTPAGIFNLADISDLAKEGANEFIFKVNGQKHTFQAANAAERDSWFVALEAKAAEAKAEKETIVASEGYKAELEKLTKPAVAEPVKKPVEAKEEAKKEEAAPVEETKDSKETTEVKDKAKSRSQSRKRASIFGSFLGKKEETEEKKEEKTEDAKPVEAAAEPVAATSATAEATEAAAPASAEEKKEETEAKKEEKKAESPAPKSKRTSLFGNFFQKVTSPSHEKSEKEAAAHAETSAVSSTAPQLENPVEEAAVKPIEPENVTAASATEAEAPKEAAAQSPAAETPAGKDKRRTSFFGNFGKKKGDSDNEGTDGDAKAKGNKLGGLFRKPSKAVKLDNKEAAAKEEDKAEPTAQETSAEAAPAEDASKPAEAPATEEAKPATVAATTTPVQAAA
ncbi:conserved lysine-rich protein [Aspergillus fumigatus Z5]|nr:conserved lysine-rich protein [Aspergillus fumigatus Z5]